MRARWSILIAMLLASTATQARTVGAPEEHARSSFREEIAARSGRPVGETCKKDLYAYDYKEGIRNIYEMMAKAGKLTAEQFEEMTGLDAKETAESLGRFFLGAETGMLSHMISGIIQKFKEWVYKDAEGIFFYGCLATDARGNKVKDEGHFVLPVDEDDCGDRELKAGVCIELALPSGEKGRFKILGNGDAVRTSEGKTFAILNNPRLKEPFLLPTKATSCPCMTCLQRASGEDPIPEKEERPQI